MAGSQGLSSVLEKAGIPDSEWWAQAKTAYEELCQTLTADINATQNVNSGSYPRIKILPAGDFACGLSLRSDMLPCIAFGNIRSDLFIEVAWHNITGGEESGLVIQPYKVSSKGVLLGISGFMFDVRYIESPELLRLYPAIVDTPKVAQSNMRKEIREAIEVLQDLELFSSYVQRHPTFQNLYYILRAWAVSAGLSRHEYKFKSLPGSKTETVCLNAEVLRDLCWTIFLHGQNEPSRGSLAAMIDAYLSLHEECLLSAAWNSCPFYFDYSSLFARSLSHNQSLSVHRWFEDMKSSLNVQGGEQLGSSLSDDRLNLILQNIIARPLLQKFQAALYVRVTMRHLGNSQLAGTKMMDFVEERFLDLVKALEGSTDELYVRPWPTRVVDIHATKYDSPYEGYWLIAISMSDNTIRKVVRTVLGSWNETTAAGKRYYSSTMFVTAELITREDILQQELKDDSRQWPRPLVKPDPAYLLNRITKNVSGTKISALAGTSQSARKLRPAMDVLSRLKHDSSFDLDDYVIGYTDRHSGIQEKSAGAWIGETTHDDWIPQGRIQYFKRASNGSLVWDRATKTDLVVRNLSWLLELQTFSGVSICDFQLDPEYLNKFMDLLSLPGVRFENIQCHGLLYLRHVIEDFAEYLDSGTDKKDSFLALKMRTEAFRL